VAWTGGEGQTCELALSNMPLDLENLVVLGSALKRGYSEQDLLHAIAHGQQAGIDYKGERPMVMYVGPLPSGTLLLEVGIVERWGVLVVAHAMPARPRFARMVNL
jgi:hypothetical protein